MENQMENKVSMFQKVQGYLNLHAAETVAIPAVATLKTQLDSNVASILQLASITDADITGYAVDKQTKRDDLKLKVLKLSTGIVAFASVNDNPKLAEKCDKTPSMLDSMRDNDFYTYSKLIINEATPIMASLTPYGVVAADLTAANTSSNNYLSVIQGPKVQINERSKALDDLKILVAKTDALLNEKIDKVMGVFIVSNASLHGGYKGSRSIDQTGPAVAPDYTGVVATASIVKVATMPYLASRSFEIENNGSVPLVFCLSTDAASMVGTTVNILPAGYATRLTTTLSNDSNATHLLIQNVDAAAQGSYRMWVVE